MGATYGNKHAMMKMLRENPDDDTTRLALCDLLDELGDPDLAQKLRDRPHKFENVSYHGSPTYRCQWCSTYEDERNAGSVCPRCVRYILAEIETREESERGQLRGLLHVEREKERLLRKYGDNP